MSNANTSLIRSLYKNFIIKEVSVVRYVTSKKIKHKVSELIIKNYSK